MPVTRRRPHFRRGQRRGASRNPRSTARSAGSTPRRCGTRPRAARHRCRKNVARHRSRCRRPNRPSEPHEGVARAYPIRGPQAIIRTRQWRKWRMPVMTIVAAGGIDRGDRIGVVHGTARLGERRDAGRQADLDRVREREERVRATGGARRRVCSQHGVRLGDRLAGRVNARGLADCPARPAGGHGRGRSRSRSRRGRAARRDRGRAARTPSARGGSRRSTQSGRRRRRRVS